MRTQVADTSISAYRSLPNTHLQACELQILRVFGPDTKLSRQQISEVTRMPLHGVCGRVNSLVAKKILIEEGTRRCPMTGKQQKLLRLPVGQLEMF